MKREASTRDRESKRDMASENRRPELRKDAVNNKWVIVSPARSRRPSDFKSKSDTCIADSTNNYNASCPFCAGNEHQCAPEIFRFPADSAADWKIRVIENLYPALARDLDSPSTHHTGSGIEVLAGFGFHDVVIESPFHSLHLSDLSAACIGVVLLAYKQRITQLMSNNSIQYVQVFKNHGASAGASLSHSHSQIIGLPVVPPLAVSRIASMKEYFDRTNKCSLCDLQSKDLLIDESSLFIAICPFAATFPFEIWIVPRDHTSHFHEIDDIKAVDLGKLLKLMLRKLALQLNNPPFNFMIHTSPLREVPLQSSSYTHWFLQIVPHLGGVAGFEIATGCYINPIFPEDSAKILREVRLPE
ncbi:ADP-glucose phosphorylase [Impatiens glandulifera]|uniref:ADP-glucose phosphorylase n=1 Tax=Impatiens glandulifera TaxID=253017 RepID=UPI001FB16552|nr:ADP-glucose phosphorylase [Impatiens glandulifera]